MKNTRNILFIALATIILTGCQNSWSKKQLTDQQYKDTSGLKSVKGMRDDLFILWSAIKEVHPGYGFYTAADSLQMAYDQTRAAIKTPLTEGQFISLVYPFLCKLRCGHTQIKHSEGYRPPVNQQIPRLPFEVLVQNHRAWITTHQATQLHTGDELISVNNIPVAQIIDHGYDLYADDGYNQTFKELFLSEYDGFEDVCNKYYRWPGPYQIKFRNSSGAIKTVQINPAKKDAPADDLVKKADNYAGWVTAETIPNARLRFLKTAPVALFKSTPFAYADTLVFKNAFQLIRQKGIKTLILDMRHNTGGDIRVATQLLSYLADSTFQIVKDVKSRLPNPVRNNFATYFDTTIAQGFIEGFKPTYKEGSWYHIEFKPAFGDMYGPFPINKTAHFDGKLLVLIDGATFSSGALLSAAVKAQRKGVIFIGRETAGSEEGCNGVTLQKLTLPNTRIIVDFPLMRVISVAKHPVPGRGIMPDVVVNYSPKDIVTQNDPDLKKALESLKGRIGPSSN